MSEPTSKFNINFVRPVYLLGSDADVDQITKLLKPYYFLNPRTNKDLTVGRIEPHFIVVFADLSTPAAMQEVHKTFIATDGPLAHKIVYVLAPEALSREQLLFCQEIGARFVCAGETKNDDLRDHLRRICIEYHQTGSVDPIEEEIETAARAHDREGLHKLALRLRDMPETEDVLRLQINVHQHLTDLRRVEAALKRLLQINPQNLWAANALGKLYLRSGRGLEGLEILRKLSHFHELNSERLLMLGNAQAVVGDLEDAEASFNKGDQLVEGKDPRFKEGVAKVKLAQKDYDGALAVLSDKVFSQELISFLNMRAILSIRSDKFEEGVEYYDYAFKGAGGDNDVKAKLKFNIGLAYIRHGDLLKAQESFQESCDLGGQIFTRARAPLEKVSAAIRRTGRMKPSEAQKSGLLTETEWETLY